MKRFFILKMLKKNFLLFKATYTFVIIYMCNFDVTVACIVRDDKSINKVCL